MKICSGSGLEPLDGRRSAHLHGCGYVKGREQMRGEEDKDREREREGIQHTGGNHMTITCVYGVQELHHKPRMFSHILSHIHTHTATATQLVESTPTMVTTMMTLIYFVWV